MTKNENISGNQPERTFEAEIALLDKIYSEIMEAIQGKPINTDYETMRNYVDNVYVILNRTAFAVKELKNSLTQGSKYNLETWNPPA
ncbi:MAG: hypothetical protein HXY49_10345 [Ignavibacteriaceae bacterium]|nr:hypothetical protein [Ignavibacteriaceae bacterium]